MDLKRIVKTMAKNQGVTMTELASRIGITRQALYHRLDHQMRAESFFEIVEALGGDVRVVFGGVAKKVSFYDK